MEAGYRDIYEKIEGDSFGYGMEYLFVYGINHLFGDDKFQLKMSTFSTHDLI